MHFLLPLFCVLISVIYDHAQPIDSKADDTSLAKIGEIVGEMHKLKAQFRGEQSAFVDLACSADEKAMDYVLKMAQRSSLKAELADKAAHFVAEVNDSEFDRIVLKRFTHKLEELIEAEWQSVRPLLTNLQFEEGVQREKRFFELFRMLVETHDKKAVKAESSDAPNSEDAV